MDNKNSTAHLTETRVSRELKFAGRILDVFQDTVRLENDDTALRDVVEHSGGVCVLPLSEDGYVLFVEQYRYPHGKATLEIPAGKLEKGEDHHQCGLRELREETGCTTENYTYLGKLFPTPAYCSEVIHMYMADGLQRVGDLSLDKDEFLEVKRIHFDDAIKMVMNNEIEDAKTQIALLRAFVLKNTEQGG